MKTKLHILFTLVLVIIFFVTCKKYPQNDPSLRLRTVSNRIHGTYILEKYIVNDIDSTNLIPPCVAFYTLDYGIADGNYYFVFNKVGVIKGMDGDGIYTLPNNKNDLGVSYTYVLAGKNILMQTQKGVDCNWKIQKLSTKDFWLKQDFNNLTYEIHLKKIHS